jgi:hypothetical protein
MDAFARRRYARVRPMKIRLAVGIACWALAVAMTPHEVEQARARAPIDARTAITLVAYLSAALLVLSGIAWRPKS